MTSGFQRVRKRAASGCASFLPGDGVRGTLVSLALAASATAQFGSPKVVPWSPCTPPLDVDSGDLDGDGDMDLIASGCSGLHWFENLDGQGSFGPAQLVAACQITPYVVVSDLDLDGDPDLVSFTILDGVRWHENQDGQGTFAPGLWIGPVTVDVTDVAAADLDSDGDPDLLCSWEVLDAVAWFENDGQGGFGPAQTAAVLKVGSRPQGVDAGDLDGDGDRDLLLALWGDNRAVWFENLDGLGSFGPQQTIDSYVNAPVAVTSGDVDGDGDLDVLAASGPNNTIEWYENTDGLGSFSEAGTVGEGDDLLVADMDCDGDLDVLASNDGGGYQPYAYSIAWHENLNGAGVFASHCLEQGSSWVGGPSLDAHAADLDGDGDREALTTWAHGGYPLSWYQNLSCQDGGWSWHPRASAWSGGTTSTKP